ncbi:Kynurenine--oxoglutarate transaminase 1 [Heterocephalus glaber]|uniref:Kynurenine--oxoglutarate transaminase 1 n=1 Tax=Heterocephalus glaber TaxID=10181 RepID=G5ASD3_HETGA|nr:Kynurenine--oxoglutarate transaminase 1 [Heterocephalus glaber]
MAGALPLTRARTRGAASVIVLLEKMQPKEQRIRGTGGAGVKSLDASSASPWSLLGPRTSYTDKSNGNQVFCKAELELVASLCQQHDVLCISDEVYQWLVYDTHQHVSIASLPGMWERTLTIGSAGKTFSVTGWKVGWVLGPDNIMKHLRTVHQNSVYHCPTQAQVAVAQCFEREQLLFGQPSSYFVQLPQAMQRCRNHMIHSLQSVGFKPVASQGGYFLTVDISNFKSKMPDLPGAAHEPYEMLRQVDDQEQGRQGLCPCSLVAKGAQPRGTTWPQL